jgi:pimeloyl-ACP methyl ester carboxylesterase
MQNEHEGAIDPPHGAFPVGVSTEVAVPDDQNVIVVNASRRNRNVIVYLHGRCAHPLPDVQAWQASGSRHGTVIALFGDAECSPGSPLRRWTPDANAIEARIDAAIRAVSAARGEDLDMRDATLVGYSEGASRAEAVARAFPHRYAHVLLIGGPSLPSPESFREVRSFATMAGEIDRQDLMRNGAKAAEIVGKPSRYFVLPGARHGQFGPEGDRVMGEALAFLHEPSDTGSGGR